jgi:capsule biosynthesis phosphatase
MRIVFDLDGVICGLRKEDQSYADVQVLPGAAKSLHNLRVHGHIIIIYTARNMATHKGNVGKAMKDIGLLTLEWLDKNQIEYDEIYFGKPSGDVYIDDCAFRFRNWEQIDASFIEERNFE